MSKSKKRLSGKTEREKIRRKARRSKAKNRSINERYLFRGE